MAFNPPFGTLAAVWKRLFYVRAGLLRLVHGVQSLRRKLVQRPYHEVGLVECSGGFRDEMVGTDDAFYAGGGAFMDLAKGEGAIRQCTRLDPVE